MRLLDIEYNLKYNWSSILFVGVFKSIIKALTSLLSQFWAKKLQQSQVLKKSALKVKVTGDTFVICYYKVKFP